MSGILRTLTPLFVVVLLTPGCGGDKREQLGSLPGPVRISPSEIPDPTGRSPYYWTVLDLATEHVFWTCVFQIVITQDRIDRGPVSARILGIDGDGAFSECVYPAVGQIRLPKIPFDYELSIAYEDLTDRYNVHIDDTVISLSTLERHFTVCVDSILHRDTSIWPPK